MVAACDYLFGNKKKWQQLNDFLNQKQPEWIEAYMREKPEGDDEVKICYIANIQEWLFVNCPINWVQEQLKENFEIQRMICGKAHHE